MDKFGIFELLDALSAIALDGNKAPSAPAKGDDPVSRPPVYEQREAPAPADESKTEPSAPPKNAGEYAISDFYRKHNERSGK